MERHAHHRQPCHTRVTQRGRPSDPDPIRSDSSAYSAAAGPSNGRSSGSWCSAEFINVIEAKDREERAKGREREQGQAQRGEGEEACVEEGVGHGRVRVAGE